MRPLLLSAIIALLISSPQAFAGGGVSKLEQVVSKATFELIVRSNPEKANELWRKLFRREIDLADLRGEIELMYRSVSETRIPGFEQELVGRLDRMRQEYEGRIKSYTSSGQPIFDSWSSQVTMREFVSARNAMETYQAKLAELDFTLPQVREWFVRSSKAARQIPNWWVSDARGVMEAYDRLSIAIDAFRLARSAYGINDGAVSERLVRHGRALKRIAENLDPIFDRKHNVAGPYGYREFTQMRFKLKVMQVWLEQSPKAEDVFSADTQ